MKTVTVSKQFSESPALISASVRDVLDQDKTATPSWSPGGNRVVVTFDSRDTLSLLLYWFKGLRIVDIVIASDGTVTAQCATPEWCIISRSVHQLFLEKVLNKIENEVRKAPSLPMCLRGKRDKLAVLRLKLDLKMKKTILIVIGAILILAGPLIVLTGTAYTFTLPKLYAGITIIQVVFPEHAGRTFDDSALTQMTKTQLELISSTPVLNTVIRNLKLNEQWGLELTEEGASLPIDVSRKMLSKSMKLEVLPESTGLISITVIRQSPHEAARIANEVAAAYRDAIVNSPQQGGMYRVSVVSPASPALRPISPNLFINIMLSFVLAGLFLLIGIALVVLAVRKRKEVQPAEPCGGSAGASPPPVS